MLCWRASSDSWSHFKTVPEKKKVAVIPANATPERLTILRALGAAVDDETEALETAQVLAFHQHFAVGPDGADKILAGALYAHDITPRWYYFGATDIDRDALQHLNLRWTLGGGLGWRVKETDRLHFDLIGGGGIDSEYFQDRTVRRSGEALFGEDLQWQIAPRMYLQERWILYPNLSRRGEYRTQLSVTLETKLNNWLSWQFTFSNHFLSDPPPETDKNDLLITSGLRVTLGRREEGRIKLRPR